MFSLTEPSERRITDALRRNRDAPLSYAEVGRTREGPGRVAGYVVDHNRVRLGEGEGTFGRAVEALLLWKMFDVGWARLVPPGAAAERGTTVGVLARHYGFWSLNVSRVVYDFEEDEGDVVRRGFAYGTLPEHGQSGEERFAVEWRRDDGAVFYDLYAFSRPHHFLAKVGGPAVRGLQRRFAKDSLRAMLRATAGGTGA